MATSSFRASNPTQHTTPQPGKGRDVHVRGGNQDQLVRERAIRIKVASGFYGAKTIAQEIRQGWAPACRAPLPWESAHDSSDVSLFYLHWTCEPGSRGSASLPPAVRITSLIGCDVGSCGRDALLRDPALHVSTPYSLLLCESAHGQGEVIPHHRSNQAHRTA